ncbi:hypothetical protein L7F22_018408 [Adiantum nelumboides]|nr:hypothetical protein [Adiantum nelumboides]
MFQDMHQVLPPSTAHSGHFGGGSVFQSIAGYALENQQYMSGTMFGGMQNMVPNPMYANIGMQLRFWGTQGQFGVSQGNVGVPIIQTVSFDNLESMDKPKSYKEGGQSVQFDTFSGFDERTKAFSFLEQFDKAFAVRNFTEAFKVRKAARKCKSMVEYTVDTRTGQIGTTYMLQVPFTWIDFIQVYDSTWLTNDFEVDVRARAWRNSSEVRREQAGKAEVKKKKQERAAARKSEKASRDVGMFSLDESKAEEVYKDLANREDLLDDSIVQFLSERERAEDYYSVEPSPPKELIKKKRLKSKTERSNSRVQVVDLSRDSSFVEERSALEFKHGHLFGSRIKRDPSMLRYLAKIS